MKMTNTLIRRMSFGKLSFACAFTAFALFFALSCINRIGVLFGGNILRALNQLGLVRQEKTYLAELKPSSIFALNDANAVLWFTCLAFILAGLGIALALHANYKHESTLYASAGFIVATLGVGLLYPWAMVLTQALGVIALISIRRSSPQANQLVSEGNKQ
ncbi:hypothetical protein [Polaromonas sp. LjRoot131]|uniref:hypothetical protein n=1 Tax=Polaromonas sp. LjRoot131 TaxID=3342262 RepID=UPI003ECC9547